MKENNEILVKKYLCCFLQITEIASNGSAIWKMGDGTPYFQNHRILLEILNFLIDLPILKGFDDEMRKIFIQNSIVNLKKAGKNTADAKEFKNSIDAVVEKYSREPKQSYRIVFLLNIDSSSLNDKKSIDFFGNNFAVYSPEDKSIPEKELEKFIQNSKLYAPTVGDNWSRFSWFIFQIEANSHREALHKGWTEIEKLRYFLNANRQFFIIESMTFGKREPLNDILPSPGVGAFGLDGKFLDFVYPLVPFNYKVVKSPDISERIKFAETLSKDFFPSKQPIDELILEAIQNFGASFDNIDPENIYLNLWQILESIALPVREEPQEWQPLNKVFSRIGTIFNQDEHMLLIVKIIYTARNRLVHAGRLSDRDMVKINLIRNVLRRVIGWLIENRSKLVDIPSLEQFFLYGTCGKSEMKRKKRVIEAIANSEFRKYTKNSKGEYELK